MNDVKVNYNSSKPAQLQAHAYAQGSNIEIGPGQEKHLPHEAWHVVQQKQGRVQPTTQLKGTVNVNDDAGLEKEADVMGAKALSTKSSQAKLNEQGVQLKKKSGNNNSSAPVQMFFGKKKKQKKTNQENDMYELAEKLVPLGGGEAGSANQVYKAQTTEDMGTSGTNKGYAKKAPKVNQELDAATAMDQIGLTSYDPINAEDGTSKYKITEDPRLIARQVMSSRLDKALGANVLTDEVFSKDKDEGTIGISADVGEGYSPSRKNLSGKVQVIDKDWQKWASKPENQDKDQTPQYNERTKKEFTEIDYSKSEIQKNLSNLQVMDALTGQQDRHTGNMFINRDTGDVKGIDNDAAFPQMSPDNVGIDKNHFSKKKMGGYKFNQKLIDHDLGMKILKMSKKDFINILKGKESDPENLDETEIKQSLLRFNAIKKKVLKYKVQGKLVKNWGKKSYARSQATGYDKQNKPTNYLTRGETEYKDAFEDKQPEYSFNTLESQEDESIGNDIENVEDVIDSISEDREDHSKEESYINEEEGEAGFQDEEEIEWI